MKDKILEYTKDIVTAALKNNPVDYTSDSEVIENFTCTLYDKIKRCADNPNYEILSACKDITVEVVQKRKMEISNAGESIGGFLHSLYWKLVDNADASGK